MKQATVIGLGRSGIAAAKLLIEHGYAVTLSDSNHNPNLETQKQQLELLGINVKLGDKFNPTTEDIIVVSPGVPWDIAPLVKARELGIDTIGEMELAWRYLHDIPWVAITGTNGKTTTTALTAAIFQAAGIALQSKPSPLLRSQSKRQMNWRKRNKGMLWTFYSNAI